METITLKIEGMHCSSCAISIDFDLEDTEGVREVSTNYARQQTEISYDRDKVSLEKILSIIQSLGYKASTI
jgi:copper chaperone CopZ